VVQTDQLEVSGVGAGGAGGELDGTGTLDVVHIDQLEDSGTGVEVVATGVDGLGTLLEDHGCQPCDERVTTTGVVVVSLTGVVDVVVITTGVVVVDQTDH